MSIKKRCYLLFGLMVGLVLILGVQIVLLKNQTEEELRWFEFSHEQVKLAFDFQTKVTRQTNLIAKNLLEEKADWSPLEDLQKRTWETFRELHMSTLREHQWVDAMGQWERHKEEEVEGETLNTIRQHYELFVEKTLSIRRSLVAGDNQAAVSKYQGLIQTHFEYGLLKPIQKFLHGEEDELERADKARKVLFARLKWFILLAAIGIPVIFGLFFLVLNRWIFLPLSRLMTASREIQGGNYEVHVPAATKDEMGNFIETFNAMAATLQQSFLGLRNHLALIVESTEDAVLGVDIKGNVISWNRGAEQIFGYPRSEIVGNSIAVLCPEDRHHELKNVLATIQAGRMDRFETQRLRKDGSKIDVSLTVSPLFEFNRNVTGASIIARDITAKKKMETELIRAKEVAEKASAGKSEFLTHLSHELRTPLNSLLGFAQLLELQAESKMGPEEKEFLQEILQAGQSLIHLINEVLDLSRIEAGEMDISMDMVDLSTVVAETFVQVQSLAKYENVSLKNQVSSREGLLALGDPVRVNQVLVNVLHNAIKYNVLGGSVTVFISFVEKDFLTLAIQDTGPGIAAEDLEKIFQPFTRLEKTAESKAGLGMGLAVAQRFMEVMGGTITVNSTVGMGTTFLLRLRRTYKSSELETAAPEPSHV